MIFDCFTFFNELDVLDVRLHEMSPVVDKFVIVEATKTFQGADKPLTYQQNAERFKAFHDKIIHIVIDFPEQLTNLFSKKYNMTWAREYHQRDQVGLGLASAKKDDLIIVSDVDEIISATKLREAIRTRSRHDLTIFTMPIYEYFLNRRRNAEADWLLGPRMIEFDRFTSGQKMRMTKLYATRKLRGTLINKVHTRLWNLMNCGIGCNVIEVKDAGWHISSVGGWEMFRKKMAAYSHSERMDTDMFKSEKAFINFMERETSEIGISELPQYVQDKADYFCDMFYTAQRAHAAAE